MTRPFSDGICPVVGRMKIKINLKKVKIENHATGGRRADTKDNSCRRDKRSRQDHGFSGSDARPLQEGAEGPAVQGWPGLYRPILPYACDRPAIAQLGRVDDGQK